MDLYEAIKHRYSVRAYEDKPVEADKLDRILDAGRLAPSSNNRQAWKFVVVRGDKLRGALAEACDQPFLANAPVIVAIVGLEPERKMSCDILADVVDCSIAATHMILAATIEGLGTCWIGHFKQDLCRSLLGVPLQAKIVALLPMGYPDQPSCPKTRKTMSEVVSYDAFS
jgi:nitroreductase